MHNSYITCTPCTLNTKRFLRKLHVGRGLNKFYNLSHEHRSFKKKNFERYTRQEGLFLLQTIDKYVAYRYPCISAIVVLKGVCAFSECIRSLLSTSTR
jgi:hypothetical protein